MRKLFLGIIMSIFISTILVGVDATTDVKKFRDKKNYFMKFRGSLMLGMFYYIGDQDGIYNKSNHTGKPTYELLDYTDAGDPANLHHSATSPGRVIGTTWGGGEIGLLASYSFIAPFFQKKGNFLLEDSNISFDLYGRLTPVSLSGGFGFTITPVPFFVFNTGFTIGSGWNMGTVFNGIGINNGTFKNGLYQPFLGPRLALWFEPTLQFDIAALIPKPYKRWTHIVMQGSVKFQYEAVPNLHYDQPWQWEADEGQNMNGWNLYTSFLFGYQIPIIEDDNGKDRTFLKPRNKNMAITFTMTAYIDKLDLSHYFDSPMSNGWGSDFVYVEFGPLIKLDLPHNMFFITAFLWKNERGYTDATVGNLFYQDRIYEDWYVYFRRIAIAFGFNF